MSEGHDGCGGREPGVAGELSAGLRALSARGIDPSSSSVPSGESADDSSWPSVPLPPLSHPFVEAQKRQPSPEGLAAADRILAAAGHHPPPPPPVISLASDPPGAAPDLATIARPSPHREIVRADADSVDDATVLRRAARIMSSLQESFVLREGETLVIGRVPGAGGLAVDHHEVSRRHVRLEVRLGQLLVTDLGSTNGTTVVSASGNTELRAQTAVPLAAGDQLVVNGDVVLCTVVRLERSG